MLHSKRYTVYTVYGKRYLINTVPGFTVHSMYNRYIDVDWKGGEEARALKV